MAHQLAKPRSRFLSKPTRGGWLTIVNCGFWACLLIGSQLNQSARLGQAIEALMFLGVFAFGLPVAFFCLLPELDHRETLQGILIRSFTLGFNSFLWGYGLSWLIYKLGFDRNRSVRWRFNAFPVVNPNPAEVVEEARL